MLLSLHIKNYVIIDELTLDFQSGMTVLSGETGAGKSIIIDALELALGARADGHVIKQEEARCEVSAIFDVARNTKARDWLANEEVMLEETLIFRRVISSDGRSRCTINGQVFPAQKVRELAQYLVDIHGQHEHQALLHPENHRLQLDEYAEHAVFIDELVGCYKTYQALLTEIENLSVGVSEAQKAHQLLLNYQLEELNEAQLEEGEVETLHQEYSQLSQVDTWLSNAQTLLDLLDAEQEASILHLLQQGLHLLPASSSSSSMKGWLNIQSLLESARIQCEEAKEEIHQLLSTMEPDPERLQSIDARLKQLHALARKHQIPMENLPQKQKELMEALNAFESSQERRAVLEAQLVEAEKAYHVCAQKLSESRKKHALILGEAISKVIQQLGITYGAVEVRVDVQPHVRSYGYDKVEYYLVTNPNQSARPLIKVASGGELSRVSLAIEVVATRRYQDLTRLFDEVDVGIGGQTAAIVGKLLRTLGENSQVICITHQPQTAAQGHHHYYVKKTVEKRENQAETRFQVQLLEEEERVQEIARMLGGLEITSRTLAHAAELCQMS